MILTNRQEEILLYLYRFRFLNRTHIQKLLGHKHFNRIIIWLNQLTKNGYLRRYYNPKTVTIAALYSLGLKGRKYLMEKSKEKESTIQPHLLNRVWREHTLSEQFRTHCLFLTDIYLSSRELAETSNSKLYFFTKTDLKEQDYLLNPHPDAYIARKKGKNVKRYFLDVFDPLPPRMILRRRIRQYVDYFKEGTWQEVTNHPFPKILLISPDERSKRYLYRYIQKTLEYAFDIEFYLTTWDSVQTRGFMNAYFDKVELAE